jgi:hypothetical protein
MASITAGRAFIGRIIISKSIISPDALKAVMYGVTGSNLAHLCTPFDRP